MFVELRKLVLLIFLCTFKSVQSVCPFSYKYVTESKIHIGLIELKNLTVDSVYDIQVQLARKEVDEGDYGSIRLVEGEDKIHSNILSGNPVKLVVNLPKYSTKIPTVRDVTINGQKVCSSSSASLDGFKSFIQLDYKLNTSKREAPKPSLNLTNIDEPPKSSTVRNDVNPSCGKRIVTTKDLILNGYNTLLGQWPWHVAIYHRKPKQRVYACGGTLIGPYHIVSASHCVTQVNGYVLAPDVILIQLGAYDLDLLSSESLQEHNVAKVSPHPNYNRFSHKNDIAVLKLETKVKLSPYVQPACLYNRQDTASFSARNLVGNVIGWGRNLEGQLSSTLKVANMPFVTFQDCLDSNRDVFGQFLSDGMFCAGNRNGTNVCDGDSGGGIFINIDNIWYLVGITAFTAQNNLKQCSTEDYAVFTDITRHIDWIESLTGPLVVEEDPQFVITKPSLAVIRLPESITAQQAQNPSIPSTADIINNINSPVNTNTFFQNALQSQNEFIKSGGFKDFFSPQNTQAFWQAAGQAQKDFYTSGASQQFWNAVG